MHATHPGWARIARALGCICGSRPLSLAACANEPPSGSTSASSSASAEAETGVPTPTPAALQLQAEPAVSFSGATDKKTTAFAVGSPLKVAYTFRGDGNFIVELTGTDGSHVASIANRIATGSATTWVYGASGKGYFDVTANGPWSIKATTMVPPIAKLPLTIRGDTDQVTAPFLVSGTLTVNWATAGSGNFIVELIDPTDGSQADSVANLIGKSTDSTQLYNHDGPFAFDVTAGGPWTLTVTLLNRAPSGPVSRAGAGPPTLGYLLCRVPRAVPNGRAAAVLPQFQANIVRPCERSGRRASLARLSPASSCSPAPAP